MTNKRCGRKSTGGHIGLDRKDRKVKADIPCDILGYVEPRILVKTLPLKLQEVADELVNTLPQSPASVEATTLQD